MKKLSYLILSYLILSYLILSNSSLLLAQDASTKTKTTEQEDFVVQSPLAKSSMTSKSVSRMTNFENDAQYGNLQMVTLGKLDKCQKNGIISIALPDRKQKVDFKVSQITGHKENDMIWFGNAVGENGYAMIISKRGTKHVYVTVGNEIYETENLEGDKFVFYKRIKSKDPVVCKSQTKYEDGATEQPKTKGARVDPCIGPIRVLFLFTSKAAPYDPVSKAWIVKDQFNAISRNTKLPNYAKLEVALVDILGDFNETNDIDADLIAIKASSSAQQKRDAANADIVVLMTKTNYQGTLGYSNMAQNTTSAQIKANAYSVVLVDDATNNFCAAHEIGHLLKAGHQSGTQFVNTHPTRKAKVFSNYGTVMAFPDALSRIPYFSDPNTIYLGEATGEANANNHEAIYNNAFAMSMVYTLPVYNTLTSYVAGPSRAKAGNNVVCEAISNCGTYPYYYQWQVSTDGFYYSGVVGTGEYLNYTMPYADNLFVLLTVTSSEGQVVQSYLTINRKDAPFSRIGIEENMEGDNAVSQITVSPNPSNDESIISFKLKKEQKIKLAVSTIDGKQQNVLADGIYNAGSHEIKYNTSQLKSGMYLCNLSITILRYGEFKLSYQITPHGSL
jgi:Metallo-peptidase family M12/Secretion system C-terminal sorting domain